MQRRSSGVLLHPTSLPGIWGIGDLGPAAHRFVDWLADAGQSVWQVLPLGPTGFGDSPYGATSSFAGNPLLVSPDALIAEGLLPESAVDAEIDDPGPAVDFGRVPAAKEGLLRRSWDHFRAAATGPVHDELTAFLRDPEHSWLADWCLYAALKQEQAGRSWQDWPEELRGRRSDGPGARPSRASQTRSAFTATSNSSSTGSGAPCALGPPTRGFACSATCRSTSRRTAPTRGSTRSSSTSTTAASRTPWPACRPTPSARRGSYWGNPLYRWDRMRATGYAWWIIRGSARACERVDLLRLDHFRGFAGYWRIPAAAEDARGGEWVAGPGAELFAAIESALGALPLIAEDLGVITPDVVELKERLGLPGMKVLQFGFGDLDSDHLPHHHTPDSVVYTGTHDNDTSRGWFESLEHQERRRVLDYLGCKRDGVAWAMTRVALTSVARLAVIPAQDLLGLGSEARMNTPALTGGNWAWRLAPGQLDRALAKKLRRLTRLTGRSIDAAHATGAGEDVRSQ